MKKVLVTGAAGFIGFHLCQNLLNRGYPVVGIDNLNNYYDIGLKKARLHLLAKNSAFLFQKIDIADRGAIATIFSGHTFEIVVNLAAQAGIRYSLIDPYAFGQSNVMGFLNVLEECRKSKVKHLIFASSSSVYGENNTAPFSENCNTDRPVSLYAATKKADEMMAHAYASLYGLPVTGLRFFTVYGPWGRPDMAYFMFTRAIMEGTPIKLFNNGDMRRDFTYIDDIIEGIVRIMAKSFVRHTDGGSGDGAGVVPYRLYNIGNNTTIELSRFIEVLEDCIGKKAVVKPQPMQPGDVRTTCADVGALMRDTGFSPHTPLEKGLRNFVEWYTLFYGAKTGVQGGAGKAVLNYTTPRSARVRAGTGQKRKRTAEYSGIPRVPINNERGALSKEQAK